MKLTSIFSKNRKNKAVRKFERNAMAFEVNKIARRAGVSLTAKSVQPQAKARKKLTKAARASLKKSQRLNHR